jgi:hypothetical protein
MRINKCSAAFNVTNQMLLARTVAIVIIRMSIFNEKNTVDSKASVNALGICNNCFKQ